MVGIGHNPSDCWAQELCYETGDVEGLCERKSLSSVAAQFIILSMTSFAVSASVISPTTFQEGCFAAAILILYGNKNGG
jgi:hypothetical protein